MDLDDIKYWIEENTAKLLGATALIVFLVAAVFLLSNLLKSGNIASCQEAGFAAQNDGFATTCPPEDTFKYDKLAIVVGNTANSPKPAISKTASKYIMNYLATTTTNAEIKVFSVSSGGNGTEIKPTDKNSYKSTRAFIKDMEKTVKKLEQEIGKPPQSNGADYFNTIYAASRYVMSDNPTKPLVIVVGSGLSDAQPLNFSSADLLHSNPLEASELMRNNGLIRAGELSGLEILWSGMGITAAPQNELDASEVRNLQSIYSTIFNYVGVNIKFDDSLQSKSSVETNGYNVSETPVNGTSGGIKPFKLTEEDLGFEPNSARFKDEEKARESLKGLADKYGSTRCSMINLEGYQANPPSLSGSSSALSQERADAVKRLLVDMSIPTEKIEAVGRGSADFDGRADEYVNGQWDSDTAQKNRVVIATIVSDKECR